MRLDIRAVLCIAAVFAVGRVWWCEDCGTGGFDRPTSAPWRHKRGCMYAESAS